MLVLVGLRDMDMRCLILMHVAQRTRQYPSAGWNTLLLLHIDETRADNNWNFQSLSTRITTNQPTNQPNHHHHQLFDFIYNSACKYFSQTKWYLFPWLIKNSFFDNNNNFRESVFMSITKKLMRFRDIVWWSSTPEVSSVDAAGWMDGRGRLRTRVKGWNEWCNTFALNWITDPS